MINRAKKILNGQKIHAVILLGIALSAFFGIIHWVTNDASTSLPQKSAKVELPIDKINTQDIWMNRQDDVLSRLETENKISDQKMKLFEDLLLSTKKKEEDDEKEKLELKKTISLLQQDLRAISYKMEEMKHQEIIYQEPPLQPTQSPMINSYSIIGDPFISSHIEEEESPMLKPHLREYSMEKEKQSVFSVDKVVPAAVSVKALLVSSVDAVCGVYANSDPVPVKLRLLDDAHMPKGVTIKLKGCLVLASAYGNISSERVYMRLERLTQVNAQGEAIETEVVGYISGEDGKFGLRGTVVDRSTKIVKNAAASGFLGGVGQVLQAAVTRNSIDSWNTLSVGTNAAAKGAANGASSAFDMLAEYYINRAEQVQPILQVNAGRIVDITFTHGFAMGDLNTKAKLKEIRQKCRSKG